MEQYEEQFSMNENENDFFNTESTLPMAFIRKVFLTFLASLGIATIGCFIGLSHNVLPTVSKNYLPFAILEIATCFLVYYFRKQHGTNLVMLCLFTFISGLTLSPIIAAYLQLHDVAIIKEALLLTTIVFSGLTSYVFITKKDFSYLSGFLSCTLWGLIGLGILQLFFPFAGTMRLVYLYGGVLIFSGYILYDVSQIIQKKTDDYILCAVSLYLDFINLFLFILQILAGGKRK